MMPPMQTDAEVAAIKTKPLDLAEHFPSAQDVQSLLDDAYANGDPGYIAAALRVAQHLKQENAK